VRRKMAGAVPITFLLQTGHVDTRRRKTTASPSGRHAENGSKRRRGRDRSWNLEKKLIKSKRDISLVSTIYLRRKPEGFRF